MEPDDDEDMLVLDEGGKGETEPTEREHHIFTHDQISDFREWSVRLGSGFGVETCTIRVGIPEEGQRNFQTIFLLRNLARGVFTDTSLLTKRWLKKDIDIQDCSYRGKLPDNSRIKNMF